MMRLRYVGPLATLFVAILSALVWPHLPAQTPIHWNLAGEADRYASPLEFVLTAGGLVPVLWLVFEVLQRIDPRRRGPGGGRETLFSLTVLALAAFYAGSAAIALGWLKDTRFLVAILGLFFAVLGNYMVKVRPNWMVGVRTPWTLENDEVWRRSQRFGGRLLVAGGVAIALLSVLAPGDVARVAIVAIVAGVAVVPVVYSYVLYRRLAS